MLCYGEKVFAANAQAMEWKKFKAAHTGENALCVMAQGIGRTQQAQARRAEIYDNRTRETAGRPGVG
jgi:hypothetical protein